MVPRAPSVTESHTQVGYHARMSQTEAKTVYGYHAGKAALVKRLHRIEGQVRGVEKCGRYAEAGHERHPGQPCGSLDVREPIIRKRGDDRDPTAT